MQPTVEDVCSECDKVQCTCTEINRDKGAPRNAQMETIGKISSMHPATEAQKAYDRLQRKLLKASQEKFPSDDSDDDLPELVESGKTLETKFPSPPQEIIEKRINAIKKMHDAMEQYPDIPMDKKIEMSKEMLFQSFMAAVPDNVLDMKASDMRKEMVIRIVKEIKGRMYTSNECKIIVQHSTFKNVKEDVLAVFASDGFNVIGSSPLGEVHFTW